MYTHRVFLRFIQFSAFSGAALLAGSCAMGLESPEQGPAEHGIGPDGATWGEPKTGPDAAQDSGGEESGENSKGAKNGPDSSGEEKGEENSKDQEESEEEPGEGQAMCGNGVREGKEECDQNDLNQATCASVTGKSGGTLGCRENCRFDTSKCSDLMECGDGEIQAGESCDCGDNEDCSPEQLDHKSCQDFGFSEGTLGCGGKAPCQFDTSQCTNCGNGILDPGEECDGEDLGMNSCASLGWMRGDLECAADCRLDVSRCSYNHKEAKREEKCYYYENPKKGRPTIDADNSPLSTFNFGDLGVVHEVVVKLSLTHAQVGDLTAEVRHNGVQRIVMERLGIDKWAEGCPYENVLTSIYDRAKDSLDEACQNKKPAMKGFFRPKESFEVYRGHPTKGPWEVQIHDATPHKSGYVYGVCVELFYSPEG